jgi:hypothetical protein
MFPIIHVTPASQLPAQFDALIAKSAVAAKWELADWLVANEGAARLTELVEREGAPSLSWLLAMRVTAERFPAGVRVPGVSVRVHMTCYSKYGSVDGALLAIRAFGGRLRDHGAAMESLDACKRNLLARTAQERAELVKALMADASVAAFVAMDAEHAASEAQQLARCERVQYSALTELAQTLTARLVRAS